MKKLLILGSDFGTYDLVREARAMGIYVVVADLMPTSPTKDAADEALLISTTDLDQLEAYIVDHKIDGILAGASEFNLDKVRTLAKKLNLPLYCTSDKAWGISRNKRKFKDYCLKHGVPVPQDFVIEEELTQDILDSIVYPVVVKPVDMCGSRGLTFCYNDAELTHAFHEVKELSHSHAVIVESYIDGIGYTAHYVIKDGKATLDHFCSVHNQEGYPQHLYSLKMSTTNHLSEFLEKVNTGLVSLLEDIGCTDGVAWSEGMYHPQTGFHMLEMGYRFTGPVQYVAHDKLSGFNTMRWMIECALGLEHSQEHDFDTLHHTSVCASYNLFTTQAGVIESIEGLETLKTMDNVVLDMPKQEPGLSVGSNVNMGVVRMYAHDIEGIINTLKQVNDVLSIKDTATGNNLFIRFTSYDKLRTEYTAGLKELNKS